MSRQDLSNIWRQRFDEAAKSGATTKDWCLQNGFSLNQNYYWNRRLRELDAEAPSAEPGRSTGRSRISAERADERRPSEAVSRHWLRVEPATVAALPPSELLTVRVSGAEIDVHTGFNAALLRSVVQALGADRC